MGSSWKIIFAACSLCVKLASQTIYLFPGQGSDERIFSRLQFDSSYRIVNIKYPLPAKGTTLKQFAELLADQINTADTNYIFVGVSLGGMISSELSEMLHPKKTIILSSAKCRSELPFRYRFQKNIPLYKLIPPFMIRAGALILQPMVEPDRKRYKQIFKSMLKNKSPKYLKRTIAMIVNWDKENSGKNIIHIHGDKDHTLPIRNIKADTVIVKGSHMMTLTKHEIINAVLKEKLKN